MNVFAKSCYLKLALCLHSTASNSSTFDLWSLDERCPWLAYPAGSAAYLVVDWSIAVFLLVTLWMNELFPAFTPHLLRVLWINKEIHCQDHAIHCNVCRFHPCLSIHLHTFKEILLISFDKLNRALFPSVAVLLRGGSVHCPAYGAACRLRCLHPGSHRQQAVRLRVPGRSLTAPRWGAGDLRLVRLTDFLSPRSSSEIVRRFSTGCRVFAWVYR